MIIFRLKYWALSTWSWITGGEPYISGHEYVEQRDGSFKCERCGEDYK
jgi:hypothetical protein